MTTQEITRLAAHLHPGQQEIRESDAKVTLVIAGTGSGKTSYIPLWILEERERIAETSPKSHGLVIAPYKILTRTTKPAILRVLEDKLGLGEWENKQDGIWKFYDHHGGGYIYFASADTPESIEGAHVHWAVMDECGQRQFPLDAFRAVERRVRFHSGRILGTTTPYVLGWLKDLADDVKAGRRPDVKIINFPSTANPKFPKDEYERARATLPAWQFRMFYEGMFDRPAGLVYSMVDDTHWIDWRDLPVPDENGNGENWMEWEGYAGGDLGFNNPTAFLYGALSPDDVLYIFDEYYERGHTDRENARAAPHKNKVRTMWLDPSSPEAIEELVQQGWRAQKCESHEVKAGIVAVIERLNTHRLVFVRGRLADTSRELDSYVWDEKIADKVVKLHDHAMDALRYMCWGLRRAHTAMPEGGQGKGRSTGLRLTRRGPDIDEEEFPMPQSRLAGLPGRIRR